MSTNEPTWIRKLRTLYIVTLAIWATTFAYVIYAASQIGDWGGAASHAIMGIGPAVLLGLTLRLAGKSDSDARLAARPLFAIQRVTGIVATAGAVLGFIPAAINIPSFFALTPKDQLYNAGMLVPWALLYIYTVVFFVVEGIRRGLKAPKLPTVTAADPQKETSDNASAEAVTPKKSPIAPNLFFVFAILLGVFTAQAELTAYTMARSGELTNLQSPGMAFSFLQFIDLIAGNAAGAIVLVFGIINFTRDSVTFRRIATPLIAVISLAITPGTVGTAVAGITGLSPEAAAIDETAKISSDWINNLMESGHPDGFLTISNGYDCAAENCDDPDSGYMLGREGDTSSVAADVCANVVAFAFSTGATAWAIAPDYVPVTLESGEDPAANEMCVTSLADYPQLEHSYSINSAVFRLIGDGEVPFQMDLVEIDMGTADVNPDAINYSLTIATTFVPDELLPGQDQLSPGTHELNDLLTAVGQARLKNPEVDPNDANLITEAMKGYPHDIFYGFVKDPDGKIRFVEIVTSDSDQAMCVSLAPWDEEFEGMPDPGTGYGVSSEDSVAALKANPHFGAQAWGHCGE